MAEHLFFSFLLSIFIYNKQTNTVDEFGKYKQILEREDEEFRWALEAEVSSSLFLLDLGASAES